MLYLTQLTGLVLIALINGDVNGECPPELNDLVLSPSDLVVKYGARASARCSSFSNYTDLSWSVPLVNESDRSVTWETDNLTDWEIQPVCYMTLNNVRCTRTLPLTIYKLPNWVSISIVNHIGPLNEGRQYELQCDIQDVAPVHLLTVNWYNGSNLVSTTNFTNFSSKMPVNHSTTLQITPSRDDDGAQYTCEAELNLDLGEPQHKVKSDSLKISISTQSIQCSDLELDPPKLVVRYGDPASVSCRSLSNHTDPGWRVPMGNVSSPFNQSVTWTTDNLTDWELQPVCYRAPDDGQCNRSLPLVIYKLPDWVSISIVDHTGPMIANKKYELQCVIQNFAPVNLLAIYWYKGDKLERNRGFNELPTKTPSNKTVTMRITPSIHEVEAQYRCEAKLKLGPEGPQPSPVVKSNLLTLTVHYAPTFNCTTSYEGKEQDSFLHHCSVMASPEAIVTWEKDGKPVKPPDNLTRADSGSYVIKAVNIYGTKKHSLTINVLYGPEIEMNTSSRVVMADEDVSLSCTAEGNPEPEVEWRFLDQTKATGMKQTLLTISKASFADDGVYTCIATNELGNVTKTVSLRVEGVCPIKLQPDKLVVEFGDSATADCSTTRTHRGLGWEASQGPVDMRNDVQLITWRVDSLTHWDIKPYCFINAGVQCELNLPVIIYKLPDRVSISTVNHTGPMIEGRRYELQCDVQNVAPVHLLTVKWYKGKHLEKRGSFTDKSDFPVNKTTTHQIFLSKDDDGVQYRCETELNLGPEGPQTPPVMTSDLLNITVHYKPVITCSDWSPMINTALNSYPYDVMGNPSPKITWYRNKSPISFDMRLRKNDSDQYAVVAANVMGNASCFTMITVEYAPTFNCPTSYEGKEQDSLLHHCSVMASPKENVTWEKDGKPVKPLDNLTRIDSGSYVITATNRHGTEKHSLTINVLYGPEIEMNTSSRVVMADEDVSLSCTAEGNPEPEVEWRFLDQTKATGMKQTLLTISKASFADDGVYTCIATNEVGNVTKTVSLRVEGACPIKLQPDKLVVEFGDLATADCSTTRTHRGLGWEASQGPVDMRKDVQLITWRVDSLTHWDIKPYCFINVNSVSQLQQCELSLPVIIYKLPDRVSISTVNHTGPMIEGGRYELQCDVQNVAPVHLLTVKWYKGKHLVKRESFTDKSDVPVNKTTTHQIFLSKDDDGVQYRCETELNLGPEGPQTPPVMTSDLLNITVHYKPVITCSDWSPMINTALNSYHDNVMGNPSPKITWYRNKSPVSSDMRLRKNDSDQYEFVVANVMGNASCVTKITVEYAPIFNCPTSYEGKEHDSFLHHCSVMASPEENVTWEKDGKPVKPPDNLTRTDSGSYVITATNKHGTEKHSLTINVLYGPEIKLLSPKEVTVGNAVSLNCTADGNPEPVVEWRFQNQIKATGRRQTTLTISAARIADAGEYTCTATNKVGSKARTVGLRVSESYLRTVLICLGILLAILIIILYVIHKYVKHRRSGKYNIQANGAVSMKLLNKNEGN